MKLEIGNHQSSSFMVNQPPSHPKKKKKKQQPAKTMIGRSNWDDEAEDAADGGADEAAEGEVS